jgi:hypothetical protein
VENVRQEFDRSQRRIVVIAASSELELYLLQADEGELQDLAIAVVSDQDADEGELQDLAVAVVSDQDADYSSSQMKHPSKILVSTRHISPVRNHWIKIYRVKRY